jgi:hypothetical protein
VLEYDLCDMLIHGSHACTYTHSDIRIYTYTLFI